MMHNTTSFKEMNSRRDANNRSVSRHSRPSSQNSMNGTYQSLAFNGVGIANKHLVCACNGSQQYQQVALKEELKTKNALLGHLREKLEHKIQKIIDLKNQLKKERDAEAQKRKHQQYKESIGKLEKEFNVQVIKSTKQ